MNKEKLDALFQEGAERYDFTYREDAWATMDGMLDDQDKKRKKRFFAWWILVGMTALVGVFGLKYFLADSKNLVETETSVQLNSTAISKPATTKTSMPKELMDQASIKRGNNDPIIQNEITEKSHEATRRNTISSVEMDATTISNSSNNNIQVKNKSIWSKREELKEVQTNFSSSKVLTISGVSKSVSDEQQGSFPSITTKVKTREEMEVTLLPAGRLTALKTNANSLKAIKLPIIPLFKDESTPDINKPKLRNRFAVGLTAGPEFSFVGGSGKVKAGYYLGLELGYQLSNHVEVIAGIGVSEKRYLGDGVNYKTEPGFWTDEITPMEFQGKCTVIEIPVAVNYYFKDASETGWFASLGATTYLMSTEWYDFIYDPTINRTDLKANWTDNMANNHLLGVGQISFGYQQKIGNHTSFQISPYAKIPLTGIGNGSVNLFSTGLRLTARFK